MTIRSETNELIYAIQLATPKSREHLPYAAAAWAALDADGQRAALEARDTAVARVLAINHGLLVNQCNKWRGVLSDVYAYDDLRATVESGFLAGVLLFDIERGFSHTTYCLWCVQSEIVKEVSALGAFTLSASAANDQRAVRRYVEAYRAEHDRRPTVAQIAQACELDEDAVRFVLRIPELISGDGFGDDDDDDAPTALELAHDEHTTDERATINVAVAVAEQHLGARWDEVVDTPLFSAVVREAMA